MITGLTYEDSQARIDTAITGFLAHDPLDINSLDNIVDGLRAGRIGVFDINGSLFFTELFDHNMHVIGMYGGLRDDGQAAEHLDHLALMLGATSITIKGRKGWEKVAAKRGYKHLYSIMEKQL